MLLLENGNNVINVEKQDKALVEKKTWLSSNRVKSQTGESRGNFFGPKQGRALETERNHVEEANILPGAHIRQEL